MGRKRSSKENKSEDMEVDANGTTLVASSEASSKKNKSKVKKNMDQEQGTSVLQAFWGLADADKTKRLDHVDMLMAVDEIDEFESENYQYAIKRLVGGLSSGRGAARQGFAVALTQLLRLHAGKIDGAQLLRQINEATTLAEANKEYLRRDAYFGRLFGYLALVRAGVTDETVLEGIIVGALKISGTKEWIQELCFEVICEALHSVKTTSLGSLLEKLGGFKDVLSKELTPAKLSLLCTLEICTKKNNQARGIVVENVSKTLPLGKNKINGEGWTEFLPVLVQSCDATPRLHSVWPKLVQLVYEDGMDSFKSFWEAVVCGGILDKSTKPKPEQKYCAFQLFIEAVNHFVENDQSQEIAPVLVQPSLVDAINHVRAKSGHILRPYLDSLMATFLQILSRPNVQHKARVDISDKLEQCNFSQKKFLLRLNAAALGQDEDSEKAKEDLSEMKAAFIQALEAGKSDTLAVGSLVMKTRTIKDLEQRQQVCVDVAKFLVTNGLFMKKTVTYPIHDSFKKECAKALQSLLTDITTVEGKLKEPASIKIGDGVAEINDLISTQLSSKKVKCTLEEMPKQNVMTRKSAMDTIKLLSTKKRSSKRTKKNDLELNDDLRNGLVFLLNHLSVQLLILEQSDKELNVDLVEVIDDVCLCTRKLMGMEDAEEEEDDKDDDDEVKEEEMAVLTDALMAILGQPLTLMRGIAKTTYALWADNISASSLSVVFEFLLEPHLVTDVTKESNEQMVQTFDDDEEEEKDDDDEEQEEQEEQADGDDIEVKDEDMKDAMNIANMLAANAPLFDDDEENEGDETKDKEMRDYDEALANFVRNNIGKQKQKQKQKLKIELERLTMKLRALDLLEVFVQKNSSSGLIALFPILLLSVMQNISEALTRKGEKHVKELNRIAHRLEEIAKAVSGHFKTLQVSSEKNIAVPSEGTLRDIIKADEVSSKDLIKIGFAQVLKFTEKLAPAAVATGEAFVQCYCKMGILEESEINEGLAQLAHALVTVKQTSLQPSMFTKFYHNPKQLAGFGYALVPKLCEELQNVRDSFYISEVLEILMVAINTAPSQEVFDEISKPIFKGLAWVLELANTVGPDHKLRKIVLAKRLRVVFKVFTTFSHAVKKNKMTLNESTSEFKKAKKEFRKLIESPPNNIFDQLKYEGADAFTNLYNEKPNISEELQPRQVSKFQQNTTAKSNNNKKRKASSASNDKTKPFKNKPSPHKKAKKNK